MSLTNILNIIGIFFRDITMIINYLFLGKYLLKGDIRKNSPLAIASLLFVAIVSVLGEIYVVPWDNGSHETTSVFSMFMLIAGMILFIKNISKGKFIFLMFVYTAIIDMTYTYIEKHLPKEHYFECFIYVAIYVAITLFVIFSIKNSPTNIFPEVIATVPKWLLWTLALFCFAKYIAEDGELPLLTEILTPVASIGVVCCVIYFMYRVFSLTYQQTEILKEMHSQKEYSEKMLKGDENLRKFRHDYRNHMIVINALLENGSTDRARDYINAMNSDISDTINKISTGNFIADAILNNKAVVAARSGNKIAFNGQIPSKGIADEDVCTLLANAIDNAIEATADIPGSIISIETAIRSGNFILDITNPVKENVKIGKNNTLKTTKKNHNEHGIGIKNIQRVVKKYNGVFTLTCENKLFSFGIRLNLNNT